MPACHLASAPMAGDRRKASIPLIRVVAMMTMHAMSHEVERTLASLTIRNLEPGLKERLRVRAAHQGRSMEAEARAILEVALAAGRRGERSLSERIHGRFAALGGVELELPPRHAGRLPPEFD